MSNPIYDKILENAKLAETCTYGMYPKIMAYNVYKLDGTTIEEKPSIDPTPEPEPEPEPEPVILEYNITSESELFAALEEASTNPCEELILNINSVFEVTSQVNIPSLPEKVTLHFEEGSSLVGDVDDKFIINNNNSLHINGYHGTVYNKNTSKQGNDAILNNPNCTMYIDAKGCTFGSSYLYDSNNLQENTVNRGAAIRNYGECIIKGGNFTAIDNLYISGGYAYAVINGDGNGLEEANNASLTIEPNDDQDVVVFGRMNGCIANNSGYLYVNGGNYNLTPVRNAKNALKNYYAVWSTNDGQYTHTEIESGDFHGSVACICTGVDDGHQDKGDCAVEINGGFFIAENNNPAIKVTPTPSQYGIEVSARGGNFSTDPTQFLPKEDESGHYEVYESGDETYPYGVRYVMN